MGNLFETGQTYRNRLGEFTVLDIEGQELRIRYADGQEQTVDRDIQRRIVRNMRFEKKLAAREAEHHQTLVPSSWGRDFNGLADSDFKDDIEGTHWRNRSELGGAVSSALAGLAGRRFESYASYRQPEFHVYDPELYDAAERACQAKFVVSLCSEGARVAFLVQRDGSALDASWDWVRLLKTLSENQALGQQLSRAMDRHGLVWMAYAPESQVLLAKAEGSAPDGPLMLTIEGETRPVSWPAWAEALANLGTDSCDLYLGVDLPQDQVLALGTRFASQAAAIMADLLPLYQACADA